MKLDLVPSGTRVTQNMDGPAQEISGSATRTFLCTLVISDQVEQESIDVSVWGSADGEKWGAKPLLKMPQRFYRGETRQILDLSQKPEIRFLRGRCEAVRWGRVAPEPFFEVAFYLQEVPAFTGSPATVGPAFRKT